jgi:hypothetical protein
VQGRLAGIGQLHQQRTSLRPARWEGNVLVGEGFAQAGQPAGGQGVPTVSTARRKRHDSTLARTVPGRIPQPSRWAAGGRGSGVGGLGSGVWRSAVSSCRTRSAPAAGAPATPLASSRRMTNARSPASKRASVPETEHCNSTRKRRSWSANSVSWEATHCRAVGGAATRRENGVPTATMPPSHSSTTASSTSVGDGEAAGGADRGQPEVGGHDSSVPRGVATGSADPPPGSCHSTTKGSSVLWPSAGVGPLPCMGSNLTSTRGSRITRPCSCPVASGRDHCAIA